jgi:beta-glucanase (GH16 family)
MRTSAALLGTVFVLGACLAPGAWAEEPPEAALALFDATAEGAEKRLTPSSEQVSAARSQDPAGVVVTFQPGQDAWPGVSLKPDGDKPWDLSAFGHVAAEIANSGAKPLSLSLRIDNDGEWKNSPWNCEAATLKPGAAGTIKVLFGYSYGQKPGFALNPKAVVRLLLFTGKSGDVQSFRIVSIKAAGKAGEKPPADPKTVRVKPKDGLLLGNAAPVDPKQIVPKDAHVSVLVKDERPMLKIGFPAGKSDSSVTFKPVLGCWDVRDCLQVRVKLRNDGQTEITPRVRVESGGKKTEWAASAAPLAAGAAAEVVVSFINATPWKNNDSKTGDQIANDAVSGVTIGAAKSDAESSLVVESIKAEMPPPLALPDWLGKRPPVEGDWVKTFEDEFDGAAIDPAKWNIYGENYWDKQSHFCKDNVIVGGGVVRLRFEKKPGYQNDDPKHPRQTDYAAGFLDTYGKWVQRYGYFEARLKLPTAPGLWPAFWMMPDRGVELGPQWKRADTGNNGMEFDILEHLTRWGPNRYNIAMHWDGYGKEHKALGSSSVYGQPDKDGFFTAGLLWTPGLAVYYCNGREVLRWENSRISSVPSDLMFTLPMGGWDNSPLDDAKLPDDFVIDYVRVWQRKDLASNVDGPKTAKPPPAPATQPPAPDAAK